MDSPVFFAALISSLDMFWNWISRSSLTAFWPEWRSQIERRYDSRMSPTARRCSDCSALNSELGKA